jgi:hypothetical protein
MKQFTSKSKFPFDLLLVFVMVAGAYLYFLPSNFKDWNSNSRLAMIKAIVEQHRLDIDSYHEADFPTNDKAFINGHYYSDKAIGSAVVGALVYFPIFSLLQWFRVVLLANDFKVLITLLAVGLPGALLAPLLYSVVKQISARPGFALLVTLAICLGTPYFKFSEMYYGHTLAGTCMFGAFLIWFRARASGKLNLPALLLSGLLIGLALITEYPLALLALPLGFYILYVMYEKKWLSNWRVYLAVVAGGLLPLALLLSYNTAVFGSPLSIGYSFESDVRFAQAHSQGIVGVGLPNLKVLFYTTLHPTMGIFWQSPVLLLAIFGLGMLLPRSTYRPEAIFAYSAIVIYLVVMSGFYMWWGGYSFTPRHLIPFFPIFGLALAFLPKKFKWPTFALTLVASAQMLLVAASSNVNLDVIDNLIDQNMLGRFMRNFQFPPTAIYSVSWQNFLAGNYSPNMATAWLHIPEFPALALLLVFEVGLIGLFWWGQRAETKDLIRR